MPRRPPNSVRIIGGVCRGRVVRFPPATALRPTPDRVRETLFNWLGQALAGRTTLEPFAGSGVLSLEALSRGAARAVVVDRDPKAVAAIAGHARLFGLDGPTPVARTHAAFSSRTRAATTSCSSIPRSPTTPGHGSCRSQPRG
jgi:16S rRNA (guanine(966)-N(2))-methyltransferase RsmD